VNIDSASSGGGTDSTADGAERTEQAPNDQQPSAAESRPAETLSRQEYSDQVRARGSPIGRPETQQPEAADNGQPGTQVGPAEGRPADHVDSRSHDADDADEAQERDATSPEIRWEGAWSLPDGRQVHVQLDGERDWMHSREHDHGENLPAGEELLSMEDEEASRAEKLRGKFFEQENCESFLDAEKEGAKMVQETLSPPEHASAHTLTPMVEIAPAPPPQADAGDALTGITVLALLSAEAVRSAARHWRAMERT
jgi:hypothetical protein